MEVAKKIGIISLKIAAWGVILLIPLMGVWTSSAMAAFANSVPWLAVTAGLLAFPGLPIAWELGAAFQRRRKVKRGDKVRERILTTSDRVLMRTLAINLVFLTTLLYGWPQHAFTSLNARGDWFLDGHNGAVAEQTRAVLLGVADDLQFLLSDQGENPYAELREHDQRSAPPEGDELRNMVGELDAVIPASEGSGEAAGSRDSRAWPLVNTLHPLVATIPSAARGSIAGVAHYIAENEPDPYLRVKALHDFVADHVAYDAPALAAYEANNASGLPPQDAQLVFDTGIGVCAGYANLMVALGREIGIEAEYIVGYSRDMGGDISGIKHAWNAVKIEGKWFLIDATWNAGSVDGSIFKKNYNTDYLLTPPAVFAQNHIPDDPRWQLLATPLSRGDFIRQVPLRPSFQAAGLTLQYPSRSQVTVEGTASLVIDNPQRKWVMVVAQPRGGGEKIRCGSSGEVSVEIACTLPAEETYAVEIFLNDEQYGSFAFAGQVEFNNDL